MEETYGIEREGSIARIKDSRGLYYVKNHPDCLFDVETLIIATDSLLPGNFQDCRHLREVWFENCIQEIPNYCFNFCSSLEHVNLLFGLKSIGNFAFAHCSSIKSIRIPLTVERIGELAFTQCTILESIQLPTHLQCLGYGAFKECPSLKTARLSGNLEVIGENCFRKCHNLRIVSMPDCEYTIQNNSFEGCSNLQFVDLKKCTGLGLRAFAKCKNLREIVMTQSLLDTLRELKSQSINSDDDWLDYEFKHENFPFVGCKKLEKTEVYRKED